VFVDYRITRDVLASVPNCKLIATRSAGYDHIDMDAARERGIEVVRVPHYGTRTVAEYAFALLFALSRHAFHAYGDLKDNDLPDDLSVYEGFDLCGKTLGVVGTGAIGKNVCEIGQGLGMNVVAYDVHPDEQFAATCDVTYGSLEMLLSLADVVTLHVPSIPATHHLIDETRFAQMKHGSYLINTARGEVVDTTALLKALQHGKLKGAGLDVLEGEHELFEEAELIARPGVDAAMWRQLVENHMLIGLPNVIVTPHIAFNTKEAKREITDTTIANITAWSNGRVQNRV